jgi:hypothetical protein
VPAARRQAVRTVAVVKQNLGWAMVYNAAAVPMAMAGWMPAWAAGLGMAASSLVVVLNAAAVAWHGWGVGLMDVLYVLIPLSVVLVFLCWERSAGPFIGASSRMWNARAHSRERLTHVNVSMTQLRILLRG